MNKVSEISETCDWKSEFGPEEIVNLIAEIIENNNELIKSEPKDYQPKTNYYPPNKLND